MNRWTSALGVSWLLVSACGGSVTHSDDTDSSDDETTASNGSGNNISGTTSGSGSGNNSAANNNAANNNSANNNSSNGSGGDDTSASSASSQAMGVTAVSAVGIGGTIGTGGTGGTGGSVSGFGGSAGSGGFGGGEFGGAGGFSGSSTFGSSASVTGGGGNVWGDIPIPPECEGWVNNNGNSSCDMELECPSEWAWSYCNNNGPSFSCECESDRNWGEYEISGVGIDAACPWAAAACVRSPEIVWGQPVCTPSFQEQGSSYCSAEAECTSTSEDATGNVVISKREWLSSYCDQTGSTWQCSCDRPDRYTNLEFAELPEGATCLDVLDWCNGGDIEPLGQVSCAPTYQSAGMDYCDAELECRYAVLVAGVEATLEERVPLNCQRGADGTFVCQCSGTTSQSFPVMAGDAWNACGEATSICAQTS